MRLLDRVYLDREVLTRDELYRAMLAADAPVEIVISVYLLPEGAYARADIAASVLELSTDG